MDPVSIFLPEWMSPFDRQKQFPLQPFEKEEELCVLTLSTDGLLEIVRLLSLVVMMYVPFLWTCIWLW